MLFIDANVIYMFHLRKGNEIKKSHKSGFV